MTTVPAPDADTAPSAGAAAAEAADRAEIARLAATFFGAFASGPDVAQRLDALGSTFLPGAILVRTCGSEPTVDNLADFIAPRLALLSGGSLVDFSEAEVDGRTDLFGDIAQRLSHYVKQGVQDGEPFTGRGTKSLQFARTSAGWRITAVAWDDERQP